MLERNQRNSSFWEQMKELTHPLTLKCIKLDCMRAVSNKGKTCKMSNPSYQKRTRIVQCILFRALLQLCSTRESNTSMSRIITFSLTFFHLLPDKYFLGLCSGIRQTCLIFTIIHMPTITSNSVETSLPLLAERKILAGISDNMNTHQCPFKEAAN